MSRRPEQLALAFLGEFLLPRSERIPAGMFLATLSGFGVPELTTRSVLNRMKERGLLDDERRGRTLLFGLTAQARQIVGDADRRVRAEFPFAPSGDGWTLVSFTIPESRRELRHRIRTALTWAGFASLRDGVWIAPGDIDVRNVIGTTVAGVSEAGITVFRGVSLDDLTDRRAVSDAWDLEGIRVAHDGFQQRWTAPTGSESAVQEIVALLADWLALLRSDPRLPNNQLPENWPADASSRAFAQAYAVLHPLAQAEFDARLV